MRSTAPSRPARTASPAPRPSGRMPSAPASGSGGVGPLPIPVRGRILIVDDEPAWCAMLGEFLDGLGHQTTAVADGLAAVHAVTADPPDLILLDVGMPGL